MTQSREQDDFFTDTRTFVAGHLIGARSFNVTTAGLLCGVTFHQLWRDGANDAECIWAGIGPDEQPERRRVGWHDDAPSFTVGPTTRDKHRPGSKGCSCGWWAYYTGSTKWGNSLRVDGVIAAWGVVTVGTLGFRAEHARILALETPKTLDGSHLSEHLWADVLNNYPSARPFDSLAAALEEFPPTLPPAPPVAA